ncbi:hypothetical protein A1O3_09902 [Capronia epimyces CBS 606.96]|uniref:C2H2-type domain-containing protein n=1 Tax=Capronia epimyces CBS 606.96 TaxID=1182542 RepID=W9XBR5_9EURO|nr:uncharacterized protein A1O3_09902 [Capronia epimyces CBS 606.96]EXJ77673.1 hypothetical protein A1O3_09902 [Capronia epimyces CBS 606.96]
MYSYNTIHAGATRAPVVIHPQPQGTLRMATVHPTTDPDVQRNLDCLISHQHFAHYFDIIHRYLSITDENWQRIVDIRNLKNGDVNVWIEHHRTILDNPPPDIFNLIADMRLNKSWETSRPAVLSQVHSAGQTQTLPFPRPPWSRRVTPSLHLTPHTPSTRSRSRDSNLPIGSSGPSMERTGSGYRRPNRRTEPDDDEESCAPAETHVSTANAGRIAPEGSRYHCSSRNCTRNYARQGDLENHLRQRHAELNTEFPLRNPHDYLRPTSQDGQQGVTVPENSTSPNLSHPFLEATNPRSPAPTSLQPGHEASDTINADTVLSDVLGAVGEDISFNEQYYLGAPFPPTAHQAHSSPAYGVQHNFVNGDGQNIRIYPSTDYFSYQTDDYMQEG